MKNSYGSCCWDTRLWLTVTESKLCLSFRCSSSRCRRDTRYFHFCLWFHKKKNSHEQKLVLKDISEQTLEAFVVGIISHQFRLAWCFWNRFPPKQGLQSVCGGREHLLYSAARWDLCMAEGSLVQSTHPLLRLCCPCPKSGFDSVGAGNVQAQLFSASSASEEKGFIRAG